jgi:hypothetical protein
MHAYGLEFDLDQFNRLDMNGDGKLSGFLQSNNEYVGQGARYLDMEEDKLKCYNDPKCSDYGDIN